MAKVVKWALEQLLKVAPADSTVNGGINYSVGNKTDAAVTAVGTTKSLMAYLKGLVQELAQRGTAKTAYVGSSSSTFNDVVNITDKGVLTGIVQYLTGADNANIKIVIDGTTILDTSTGVANPLFTAGNAETSVYSYASLPFNHRFNTSLQVQHKNSGNAVRYYTIVTYTTD